MEWKTLDLCRSSYANMCKYLSITGEACRTHSTPVVWKNQLSKQQCWDSALGWNKNPRTEDLTLLPGSSLVFILLRWKCTFISGSGVVISTGSSTISVQIPALPPMLFPRVCWILRTELGKEDSICYSRRGNEKALLHGVYSANGSHWLHATILFFLTFSPHCNSFCTLLAWTQSVRIPDPIEMNGNCCIRARCPLPSP